MQADIAEFIDQPYDNIEYKNTSIVDMKGNKPKESWMKEWTQEQRFEKFFEFCDKFDKREDKLLKEDYQIFSHRLHWHEHPFCERMQEVKSSRDRLWYTLVFSFTNEHWGTLTKLMEEGEDACREHFSKNRHARNDLFQIYYPKDTVVKEWLLEGPKKAADALHHTLENVDRPYTMMEYSKILEKYFKKYQAFRSPLYPCKNASRYLAMSYPHIVDPESILFGGTGHFDGMQQIFGGKNLNGKVRYDIDENGKFVPKNANAELWLEQMNTLVNHPKNPMTSQKYLNVEDKTCFFYKHIAITHGVKSPTKRIPYTWIFPNKFSLKK